jgi:pyruvate dehydrogenase phosphatase
VQGACAVSVIVDEDSQNVYVAHAGDTRAVAGYWIPAHTGPWGLTLREDGPVKS